MTRDELSAELDLLKSKGVAKYTQTMGVGFTVEFWPVVLAVPEDKPPATKDAEVCACGHHLHIAHINGLCAEGCTEAECNPEKPA